MGTKRVSLLVEVGGFDSLKMVSNRNMNTSASIVVLPRSVRNSGTLSSIGRWRFAFRPAIRVRSRGKPSYQRLPGKLVGQQAGLD
jgi:hypothetical protein